MACPSHRITTAQVRAGAPLQPALIWTATGSGTDLDTLSSNGVPVWYDEDGQEHAAPTWTWTWQQRSAAGARGGSVQSGYGTAYLPLDSARNQLPIIDLLRDGRHTGRHWVAIDIDPTGGHLIRPDAVRLLDHGDEIAPPDATWRPATVTAAAVARGVYPGPGRHRLHGARRQRRQRAGPLRPLHGRADGCRPHRGPRRHQPAHRPDARRVRRPALRRGRAACPVGTRRRRQRTAGRDRPRLPRRRRPLRGRRLPMAMAARGCLTSALPSRATSPTVTGAAPARSPSQPTSRPPSPSAVQPKECPSWMTATGPTTATNRSCKPPSGTLSPPTTSTSCARPPRHRRLSTPSAARSPSPPPAPTATPAC